MGIIIKKKDISFIEQNSLMKPLVYCYSDKEIEARAVSLNYPIAEKLLHVNQRRRTMRIEKCLRQVIDTLTDKVVLKDFDVLFNPDYEIDVLKILIALYRVKTFDILWPGRYKDGKLIYAEEGFCDYKVFDIKNYDITCVVQEDVTYEIF